MRKTYADSPYNFIPYPSEPHSAYKSLEALPDRSYYDSERFTGWLTYTLTAQTKLFVSNGETSSKLDFYKANSGYAIPGTTMKGVVRANCEVLSHAFPAFVADQTFSYREVASRASSIKTAYEAVIKTTEERKVNNVVRVGLLVNKNDAYKIYPFSLIENYDSTGRETYFQFVTDAAIKRTAKAAISKKTLDSRSYAPYVMLCKMKNNTSLSNSITSNELGGYEVEATGYQMPFKALKDKVENAPGQYVYLMNSNKIYKKKRHYTFKADYLEKPLTVHGKVVAEFKARNQRIKGRTEEGQAQASDYDALPSKGNCRPCFYVENKTGGILAIGYTPYMRLPYKYSTHAGLPTREAAAGIDFAEALFGTAKGYASRVSFENADLTPGQTDFFAQTEQRALLEPKPTAFQMYLTQTSPDLKKYRHYNSEDLEGNANFTLRGRKFYWLKETVDPYVAPDRFQKSFSTLKPVKAGTRFQGRIRFENLSEAELGLLIYSLKLDDTHDPESDGYITYESIGQGKPYGFGRVHVGIDALTLLDMQSRYVDDSGSAPKEGMIKRFKEAYRAYYNEKISPACKFEALDNEVLWAYRLSKELPAFKTDETFRYMDLKAFKDRPMLKGVQGYIEQIPYRKAMISANYQSGHAEPDKTLDVEGVEAWAEKHLDIAVLSNSREDENRFKLLFRRYKSAVFLLKGDVLKKSEAITACQAILFNNLSGVKTDADYDIIAKIISLTPNKLFFYYNDKGQFIDRGLTAALPYQAFASAPPTVMPNFHNLVDYWRRMENDV